MSFFHWFYVQPMGDVYLEMFLMFSAWTIFTIPLKGKVKRIIGAVFAVLSALSAQETADKAKIISKNKSKSFFILSHPPKCYHIFLF